MTAFTNYLENQVLAHIFRTATFTKPTTLYVGLITTTPTTTDTGTGETGTVTEASGGSYARVAVAPLDANWTAATGNNGTTSNVAAVTFPACTADWGTVNAFGIWDASTAGNLLVYSALTTPRTITAGSTPSFGAGALTVQVDN